jgi:hypothetical protein
MIIVKLVGGLGNQMFQYALGRHLAHLNNTELKLDTSYLLDRRPRPNVVFRDFDLPIFNIKAEVASDKEVAAFTGSYTSKLRAYWHHRVTSKVFPPKVVRETSPSYDPNILETEDNSYLVGYWQSEKYFKAIEDTIRADFTFKQPVLRESEPLAQAIRQSNSVCLNVRRTDFVTVPSSSETLGFVGSDYYKRAMANMEENMTDLHYFVFSDDLEWCKNNLKTRRPLTFVEHDHAGNKFCNYLQLMTFCKHFIIPNSTFAWWGAWLSKGEGKTVILPVKWFASISVQHSSIHIDNWITV